MFLAHLYKDGHGRYFFSGYNACGLPWTLHLRHGVPGIKRPGRRERRRLEAEWQRPQPRPFDAVVDVGREFMICHEFGRLYLNSPGPAHFAELGPEGVVLGAQRGWFGMKMVPSYTLSELEGGFIMTAGEYRMVTDFEARLQVGAKVTVCWTNCSRCYRGLGTVDKLNGKSIRVALDEDTWDARGTLLYERGTRISVPSINNIRDWSAYNRVEPVGGYQAREKRHEDAVS